ncbi:hypothetical protein [Hyphococcus sp.]|uniref:hypothetical protein n=1 Tax=Hyphococcus sp. TaxID=2038636 RepID=UPI003CCC3FC8
MTILDENLKFSAEITVRKPRNMVELYETWRSLGQLAEVRSILDQEDDKYKDKNGHMRNRIWDARSDLEKRANEIEIMTPKDARAALDMFLEMFETDYADQRDASILQAVRRFVSLELISPEMERRR